MSAAPICDDCICGGAGCAFVTIDEQPYFQAYRLASRIAVGEPWRGFDYIIWIGGQWKAWRKLNGLTPTESISPDQREAFEAWLFARVSHPEAVAA